MSPPLYLLNEIEYHEELINRLESRSIIQKQTEDVQQYTSIRRTVRFLNHLKLRRQELEDAYEKLSSAIAEARRQYIYNEDHETNMHEWEKEREEVLQELELLDRLIDMLES